VIKIFAEPLLGLMVFESE